MHTTEQVDLKNMRPKRNQTQKVTYRISRLVVVRDWAEGGTKHHAFRVSGFLWVMKCFVTRQKRCSQSYDYLDVKSVSYHHALEIYSAHQQYMLRNSIVKTFRLSISEKQKQSRRYFSKCRSHPINKNQFNGLEQKILGCINKDKHYISLSFCFSHTHIIQDMLSNVFITESPPEN